MGCYVLDTTVLSNFSHVQRPDLVRAALGEQAFTTPAVRAELDAGMNIGLVAPCDWDWLSLLTPDERMTVLAQQFLQVLDTGEAESLAAVVVRECVFLSDDLAARRLVASQGVRVSGTLGVLILLVKRDVLDPKEADDLLRGMMAKGYRSPVASLSKLL